MFLDILPSFDSCSSVFKNAKCRAKCPANTYARNKNSAGSSILTKCSCQGQNCLWAVGKTIKPDLFCISEYRWSFLAVTAVILKWPVISKHFFLVIFDFRSNQQPKFSQTKFSSGPGQRFTDQDLNHLDRGSLVRLSLARGLSLKRHPFFDVLF